MDFPILQIAWKHFA